MKIATFYDGKITYYVNIESIACFIEDENNIDFFKLVLKNGTIYDIDCSKYKIPIMDVVWDILEFSNKEAEEDECISFS